MQEARSGILRASCAVPNGYRSIRNPVRTCDSFVRCADRAAPDSDSRRQPPRAPPASASARASRAPRRRARMPCRRSRGSRPRPLARPARTRARTGRARPVHVLRVIVRHREGGALQRADGVHLPDAREVLLAHRQVARAPRGRRAALRRGTPRPSPRTIRPSPRSSTACGPPPSSRWCPPARPSRSERRPQAAREVTRAGRTRADVRARCRDLRAPPATGRAARPRGAATGVRLRPRWRCAR